MAKEYKMSQARYDELQEELNYLKTTRSDEVAEQIKVARGFGDLSENSEYDEAKNEQGKLYSHIAEVEEILQHAGHCGREQQHRCGGHRLQGNGGGTRWQAHAHAVYHRGLPRIRPHARGYLRGVPLWKSPYRQEGRGDRRGGGPPGKYPV